MPASNQLLKLKQLSVSCINLRRCASTVQVKPHVPLIRFRKGTLPTSHASVQQDNPSVNVVKPASFKVGNSAKGSGFDEALLPSKYQRKSISQMEMEIIEQGGAF